MLDESQSGTWDNQECQNFERQGGKSQEESNHGKKSAL